MKTSNTITIGTSNSSTGGYVDTWGNWHPWPQPTAWPWDSSTITVTYWPACSGNAHVWACDHARECQCGKAIRRVETCGACGK